MLRTLLSGIGLLLTVGAARAQEPFALPHPAEELVIAFDSARTLPDDDTGAHIAGLLREPAEPLRLPDVDTTGARFLSLFYSRSVAGHEGDPTFSILALPHPEGWLLYPDLDNDEDLRDDGPPQLLVDSTGVVTFTLVAPHDPQQVTRRRVQHVPTGVRTGLVSETWVAGMMDEEGNLKPFFAGLSGLSGERGTFLFDDRPVFARGVLRHGADTLHIGVYDWNVNGRYDDEEDLLLVDVDGDGVLVWQQHDDAVFRLDEVFEVQGRRYRLSYVDPYGRGVRAVEVTDAPTERYLAERRAAFEAATFEPRERHPLDASFWDLALPTLDGDTLRLADLRGRPLLLNVWGEWCSPCRMEMPSHVAADSLLAPDGLQIVGVLSTGDEAAARAYLAEVGATWPQVTLTDAFREWFNIRFYPTNLFIAPEGEAAIEAGVVNLQFLEQQMGTR